MKEDASFLSMVSVLIFLRQEVVFVFVFVGFVCFYGCLFGFVSFGGLWVCLSFFVWLLFVCWLGLVFLGGLVYLNYF